MSEIKDIGELKQQVVIESASYVQDDTGEAVETWSTLATVWAKVEMLVNVESGEKQLADKKTNIAPVFFTIRLRSDIDETMRISYRSATYEILNIAEVQDRCFQVIETNKYG